MHCCVRQIVDLALPQEMVDGVSLFKVTPLSCLAPALCFYSSTSAPLAYHRFTRHKHLTSVGHADG